MKLFMSKTNYPGKPENETPVMTSNHFSRSCFLRSVIAFSGGLCFFFLSRGFLLNCHEARVYDLTFFSCILLICGTVFGGIYFAVRELTFLFHSRPSFVELYSDRITGRAYNSVGPGPKNQYFSIPLDKAAIRAYDSDRLTIYTEKNVLVCYSGACGKKIERLVFKT